jgi:hypothetical protein
MCVKQSNTIVVNQAPIELHDVILTKMGILGQNVIKKMHKNVSDYKG